MLKFIIPKFFPATLGLNKKFSFKCSGIKSIKSSTIFQILQKTIIPNHHNPEFISLLVPNSETLNMGTLHD